MAAIGGSDIFHTMLHVAIPLKCSKSPSETFLKLDSHLPKIVSSASLTLS